MHRPTVVLPTTAHQRKLMMEAMQVEVGRGDFPFLSYATLWKPFFPFFLLWMVKNISYGVHLVFLFVNMKVILCMICENGRDRVHKRKDYCFCLSQLEN